MRDACRVVASLARRATPRLHTPPARLLSCRRHASSTPASVGRDPIESIRNIGIIAHIDAGKTTASERMLYLCGHTSSCGDVHTGDTVMDFLPQERERGITIKAAAITLKWRQHVINLIDTPGHVDFTLEVERSMRVLDGAVALYDAVAGVQAQSETVFAQARRNNVPLLGFVNKMDREGASYTATADSVAGRLGATPLLLQLPVGDAAAFAGVVDLISMQLMTQTDPAAKTMTCVSLLELRKQGVQTLELKGCTPAAHPCSVDVPDLIQRATHARESMLDALANADDVVADAYLNASDARADLPLGLRMDAAGLHPTDIRAAIRRIMHKDAGGTQYMPLLCGSAYRFMGMQPLLDAVVDYLPSPTHAHITGVHAHTGASVRVSPNARDDTVALAFKVQNTKARGPLVYFRVYSGTLSSKAALLNASTGARERPGKLLQLFADEVREVDAVAAGHIAAATGLKSVRTGDTLCDPAAPMRLHGITVPPPVFTASVQVDTATEEASLNDALAIMTREDPSLRVRVDAETGETLLGGMGELHLDIAADRLRREYGVNARLGQPCVAYKESIAGPASVAVVYDKLLMAKRHHVKLAFTFSRLDDVTHNEFAPIDAALRCMVTSGPGSTTALKPMPPALADALRDSVASAFDRGPLLGYPITGVRASLLEEQCEISTDSTPVAVRACVARCFSQGMTEGGVDVLEPMMHVQIVVPDAYVGDILTDLGSSKRAQIKDVVSSAATNTQPQAQHTKTTVHADVPLRSMVGYSTWLRSHTAGEGSFSMEYACMASVGPLQQRELQADRLR